MESHWQTFANKNVDTPQPSLVDETRYRETDKSLVDEHKQYEGDEYMQAFLESDNRTTTGNFEEKVSS
jgi:hypothetical protein